MKKALVVRGGWDGHEPVPCSDIFIEYLKGRDYDVEVSDSLDSYLDAENMQPKDLVVQSWTMGAMTGEQTSGLLAAVKEGTGFAGWHGGMCDAFRDNTEYQWMTGGNWVAHPGNIMEYEVNITAAADPIVEGLADFRMHSEQYYLHTDPGNEVLAETTFRSEDFPWIDGTTIAQVWKRMWGKGRVFYNALGHVASDFDVPEARTIMERGLIWATR